MSEHKENNNMGYEKKDINIIQVMAWGVGTVILVVLFVVFLNEYFMYVKEDVMFEQALEPESVTLLELRSQEDSLLTSYGWSDTSKTSYRIPIDQAMKLVSDSVASLNK